MSIYVACRCGQAFSAPPQYAGHAVPCPACGQALFVPSTTPAPQPIAQGWQISPTMQPSAVKAPARPSTSLLIGGIVGGVLAIGLLAVGMSLALSGRPAGFDPPSSQPTRGDLSVASPPPPTLQTPAQGTAAVPPGPATSHTLPSPTSTALTSGMKLDRLPIADGIYQLEAPGAEWDGAEGPSDSAGGVTFRGGAHFRQQLAGDPRSTRLVHVNWVVDVKPQDLSHVMQNPAAKPITINGLSGHEIREGKSHSYQHHLHFKFADHAILVTFRCPEDRLNTPEVQRVKQSLRRLKPIPADILALQKPESLTREPVADPKAEHIAKANSTPPLEASAPPSGNPHQLVLGRGRFTLVAPGAKLLIPEQAGGQRGGNEFFIGTAELPNGVGLNWFLVYMPNRDSDLKMEVMQHFNRRGQMTPPGSENAQETPLTVNGMSGVEKRFPVLKEQKTGQIVVQRIIYLGDHALYYTVVGTPELVDGADTLQVLNSLKKGF